ncbi:IS4 family transposase [Paraburkholderia youngii]|uniref:IS4 family transposase n=1 Tax=Paraburkholderia youngii TaxID=2782701 RepID=UPI003D1F3082
MRLARTCAQLDASLFFDADELHGAHVLSKKPCPKKPPTLNEMIRMIASLRGSSGARAMVNPARRHCGLASACHERRDHHPDPARRVRHCCITFS